MTKQPWFKEVYDICVTFPHGTKRVIETRKINLAGWAFLSHVIKERDSFGPVTSLLRMRDPQGRVHEYLI